jgi:hypothetical protein
MSAVQPFTLRRIAALTGAIACVASAPAVAADQREIDRALAQERAYMSAGGADAAARAQEAYYSSYGDPEPITRATPGEPGGGDVPWAVIVLGAGGAVALAGTSLRVVRTRRRDRTAEVPA